MGLETRNVPASNLVFTRSTRLNTHTNFYGALQACLPVHELFFRSIQPEFLMTFGSLGNFKLAVRITKLEERSAEHGTWKAHRGRAVFDGKEVAFGNVPHMSLWASDSRKSVVDWVLENMPGRHST